MEVRSGIAERLRVSTNVQFTSNALYTSTTQPTWSEQHEKHRFRGVRAGEVDAKAAQRGIIRQCLFALGHEHANQTGRDIDRPPETFLQLVNLGA